MTTMPETRSQLDLDQSHAELHDLCQPLTALQCCLEMTRIPGHAEPLERAIEDSLQQTRRLFEAITRMRRRLLTLEPRTEPLPLDGPDLPVQTCPPYRDVHTPGDAHGNGKY